MTNPVPGDEQALVERARTNRDDFGQLYERHFGRVYSYLYYRVGNRQDAEDLAARVFVQALSHLADFNPEGGSFSGWLMTIAHNLSANWFRDQARRRAAPLEAAGDPVETRDVFSPVEESDAIVRRIRGLPPEQQHIILLRYVEGLSHAEIARIVGRSEGAVRVQLHRSLQSLRDGRKPGRREPS